MAAGKEIKRLRGNISAQQAASLMGVDVERLRKWEQRDVDPKDSGDIQKIEAFFRVPLSKLHTLDNFQFSPIELRSEVNEPGEKYMTYNDKSIYNLTESNRMLAEITHRMGNAILDKVALLDEIKSNLDKMPDSMGLLTDLALKGQDQMMAKLLEQFADLKKFVSSSVQPSASKKISANQRH